MDTNVISELRKIKPHSAVVAWLAGLSVDQIYISAVTLGEMQRGIEKMRRRDPAKAVEMSSWIDRLEMSSHILVMDSRCFREWARLMEGKSDDLLEDAMIAATARVHALSVATRDEKDFVKLEVELFNPFRANS